MPDPRILAIIILIGTSLLLTLWNHLLAREVQHREKLISILLGKDELP